MASFWEVQRVPAVGDLLDDMMTYVSQPDGLGRQPAVIVAHEGLGLTEKPAVRGGPAGRLGLFRRRSRSFPQGRYHAEGVRGSNPVFSLEDPGELHRAVVANMRDENLIAPTIAPA